MQEVRVRAARGEDVGAMEEVLRESAGAPQWGRAVLEEMVRARAGAVAARVLVAEAAGAVVGLAVVRRVQVEGEPAEMESVAVGRAWRRRGVGQALCAAVEGWAREAGAGELLLEVREGNGAARALYVGRGFVEVGRRRGYYSAPAEDAVVLRLGL